MRSTDNSVDSGKWKMHDLLCDSVLAIILLRVKDLDGESVSKLGFWSICIRNSLPTEKQERCACSDCTIHAQQLCPHETHLSQ